MTAAKYKKFGVIAFAAAGLIVSPFIFSIIGGMIGIIVAIVIGLAAVNLAPAFGVRLENMKIKQLVAAVEANPIESLQNSLILSEQELEDKHRANVAFETEVRNCETETETIKDEYPDEAPQFEQMTQVMQEKLADRKEKYKAYAEAVEDLKAAIRKATMIYKAAAAMENAAKLAGTAESRVFDQIKREVAFGQVRTNLNKALSELNNSVDARIERPQLVPRGATRVVVSRPLLSDTSRKVN